MSPNTTSVRVFEQEVKRAEFLRKDSQSVSSNWKMKVRSAPRLLLLIILVLSADIQLNLGHSVVLKYPRGIYRLFVRVNVVVSSTRLTSEMLRKSIL